MKENLLARVQRIFNLTFMRFALVGVTGLSLNICVVYLLRGYIGLVPSRIFSYGVAVTMTWLLNRCFTFRSRDPKKFHQWSRYLLVYLFTGIGHVVLFALLVKQYLFFSEHPIIPIVMIAALLAVVNFSFSKRLVFKVGQ